MLLDLEICHRYDVKRFLRNHVLGGLPNRITLKAKRQGSIHYINYYRVQVYLLSAATNEPAVQIFDQ